MKKLHSLHYWPLFGLLIGLIGYQLTNINLGHFWDESWVYAPAIRSMANAVPSILPDALQLGLSRGHPLLFQFLGGVWMKIFGLSNASAHSFALVISCSIIAIIYVQFYNWKGLGAAISASLLIAIQPIFIAQSASLYPEMLMSFGFMLALIGYSRNKIGLFVVGLCVAIYSKETAVVFYASFFLWDVGRIIIGDQGWKCLIKYGIPLLVLLSHPILLYLYHGWFLYPEHTGYITYELADIKYNLRKIFRFLFESQNRGWIAYPAMIIAALSLKLKKFWMNALLVVLGFCAYKLLIWHWQMPDVLYPIVMLILCVGFMVFWYFTSRDRKITSLHHFIGIGYITIIGFILFSAMNFYTPRYMLSMVILLGAMVGLIVWNVEQLPKWSKYVIIVGFSIVSLQSLLSEKSVGELNLGLYDDLRLQGKMVDWMIENADRDDIVCSNFVTTNYLINEYAGYVNNDNFMICWFPNICDDCYDAEYIIYTKTTDCSGPETSSLVDYTLVYADTLGESTVAIYHKPELIPEL